MLTEALVALAAGGGSAVVQAAGTDAWVTVRERVARLLGRGEEPETAVVRDRLERTAAELQGALEEDGVQERRVRLEAAWRARFEDLMEGMSPAERLEAAGQLTELVEEVQEFLPDLARGRRDSGAALARDGVAIAGNVVSHSQDGSVSAGGISGGVHLSNPPGPGSESR
ncbi:hypothetical protein ABZX77_42085 [Streptomyces sp. NPDC004237]|uniref:hypothetical protein n=1 Tax=Streptomyces sp. NPDC004237 TaxID=3154455 RepID=UPI0033A58E48